MSETQRTAVITGATSDRGIGMAVADRYGREGWAVVVLDLDGEKSAKVAAEIGNRFAVPAFGHALDVTSEASVAAAQRAVAAEVECGALPPVGTFVTGYRVFPFVGVIEAGHTWKPQASEVARVLEFTLADLIAGHEMQRLLRKGVPIKTPTYTVDGHLVWGATARILQSLLERLEPIL